MFIPLIPKDPERSDFTCRDGEIDFVVDCGDAAGGEGGAVVPASSSFGRGVTVTLTPEAVPEAAGPHTLRIPLQGGDKPKAELLLGGEASRVEPAVAERLTQEMVTRAAALLLDISTDLRRRGLFILPLRYYTMTVMPDGSLSYPSAQGVALPVDRPPHPEIVAASVTDDCMTLAVRFPVTPHRLTAVPAPDLPAGHSLRVFVSYPLYIPDPKEMRGSLGSVRSVSGGQALGIRFAFLSASAMKASVAAPEKYHELTGNERTGYRFASKAASAPDYACYAELSGKVAPFRRGSLLALGEGVDPETDPMDWIADWIEAGEGYLPAALPSKYLTGGVSVAAAVWPDGIDGDAILSLAESLGMRRVVLTRPMALADDSVSRRRAAARGIRTLRVLGLAGDLPAHAILYGSDDGVRWAALRRFDPRVPSTLLAPPRLFWRLLLMGSDEVVNCALSIMNRD